MVQTIEMVGHIADGPYTKKISFAGESSLFIGGQYKANWLRIRWLGSEASGPHIVNYPF